jgi:hypothetical protein
MVSFRCCNCLTHIDVTPEEHAYLVTVDGLELFCGECSDEFQEACDNENN